MATQKVNQGSIGTISPAMGPYRISTDIDISVGYTGVMGEVYDANLQPVNWAQGVTGIEQDNFTNLKDGTYR